MKIAVTSKGETPSSEVDQRFGRCDIFLVFDKDLEPIEIFRNMATQSTEGAGIKAASSLTEAGIDVLITGNVGPNAFRSLEVAGIKVYTGASGTVQEALQNYSQGKLERTEAPTSMGHH